MRFINNLKFGILCLVALRALGHPVVQAPSPTGTLDATLGSVDTPKNVFVACDPTDAVCSKCPVFASAVLDAGAEG